jgi:hypothetical protein|nr:MAG TPA: IMMUNOGLOBULIN-BINDING PROTEIN EIBD ADHESION, VIRULENCE, BETA-HELIX.99A [Caudoviricetes sp.]
MKTNKVLATTSIISALAVNVFASGVVTGPVEPNTTAPTVSGYNSAALGVNTTVSGASTIVLGRDNNVVGDNNVVIGSNNGTINAGQSTFIGYNNTSVDNSQEQTVIGANSTVGGQGAMALGTHAVVTAWDAVGIGNNIIADKQNSVAIGTNSVTDDAVGVDGIDINGTRHIFAGEQPASVVSFGARNRAGAGGVTYYNRQLQNVSAGRVEADSLDAINGSQLYAVVDEVNTIGGTVNGHTQQINRNANNIGANTNRINNLEGTVNTNTTAINNLTGQVTVNTKDIADLKGKANTTANTVNNLVAKTDANTTAINQVNDRVSDTTQRIDNLGSRFNNVDQRMNKLGASSAALAGLHPLEYNKNDKGNFAISYGHYRNANAVALGAFYSPNEKVRLGFGITLGGETQLNINAAFRTGKGSEYEPQAKNGELEQLRKEVAELKALVTK